MNFSTLALRVLKASDFVAFDGQPAPNRPCLPDVYPPRRLGRKGLRVFREGRRLPFRLPIFSRRSPKRLLLLRKFLKFPKCMGVRYRLFDPFLQHFLRFAQRPDFDGRPPQRADVHKQKKIALKRGKIYDAAEPEAEISERRVTLYEKVTRSGAGAGHVHVPRHHQQRSLFR